MQSSNLSIYFVIGKHPNEIFDSSRIGCYSPISNSLLLNSISRLFFDLPDQHFQVFGIGQEKDYMLLQHTNNIAYCQLGNNNDEFFKISANKNIKFNLFSDLKVLFENLNSRIINDSAKNILIILQDHGSLYNFNYYPHAKILFKISKVKGKNFLIYDDSCQSGSLIDMFKKNNLLFSYFQIQDQSRMTYFLTPINEDFFNKLQKDSNFDISTCNEMLEEFSDINSFLSFLKINNVKNLANLMMIKLYYEFTNKNTTLRDFDIFSEENYNFFLDIEKVAFEFPKPDKNGKFQRLGEFYSQVNGFFCQYYKKKLFFFKFISSLEIITSTSLEKTSLGYSTISVNSITKIFPNTPAFAYFIQNAFFNIENHPFNFIDFKKHICKYETKKKRTYTLFPFYNYQNCVKPIGEVQFFLIPPKHFTYPNEKKSDFEFIPSFSLTKKIAAIRFLTHFVKKYFSHIQKPQYLPKLSFSSGFSRIPSNLLINFISLSILPSSDAFPSELKLNNEFFLNVLKFANLIFQTNSIVTSIDKRPKQISINKDRFEFITFFSVVLSSKIRYTLAKNLLLVLSNKSNFNKSIHLFSIKELEYTKKFLQSKDLHECTLNASTDSKKQFLAQLFSENFIKKYYSIIPPDKKDEKSKELNKLLELKKLPEFNLQKMFLDLESSILNILPNDVFVFSIIYSYLLLKYHKDYDKDPPIQEDIQKIYQTLSQIFDVTKIEKIIEKLNVFNCLKDILQYCNNYIFKALQKTFDFLQYFYQTYYYVSFCRYFFQYNEKHQSEFFDNFLSIIPSDFDQRIYDSLTENLEPFPLFCLPFIFFDPLSYKKYKTNLHTFISNPLNQLNGIDYNKFPDSADLLESNHFYSEQFRIHFSNLSLYCELKKSVIKNINILNKYLDVNDKEFSDLMSQPFFQNPFSDSQGSINNNDIDFLAKTHFDAYMKQSISFFIRKFKSNMKQFLQFDLEEIIQSDCINCTDCTDINDLQLFFYSDDESNVYIDSILNNMTDLMNTLSISKIKPTLPNFINEDIINLAYSVLAARFNNKVEIEPIDELIPEYETKKLFDKRDWEFPSNGEFMALCSAVPFTLSPTDKFRKRFFSTTLNKKGREEEEDRAVESEYDDYYSPPNSSSTSPIKKTENYRNEFSDNDDDDFNKPPSIQVSKYEEIVHKAFNISETNIYDIQEKYDVRFKKWTEIIWNIFFDIFNKKLKEVNLNFDTNNKYSKGFYGIDCLNIENSIIRRYFPQFDILKDLQEKEIWIGRFICLHQKYEFEIKSAYLYAILSTFVFLGYYYTFDTF